MTGQRTNVGFVCKRLFRLRAVWALVAVCGIGLTWVAYIAYTARVQKMAVAALAKEEGVGVCDVEYNYFDPIANTGAGIAPYSWEWPGKSWFRSWLGRDWTNCSR